MSWYDQMTPRRASQEDDSLLHVPDFNDDIGESCPYCGEIEGGFGSDHGRHHRDDGSTKMMCYECGKLWIIDPNMTMKCHKCGVEGEQRGGNIVAKGSKANYFDRDHEANGAPICNMCEYGEEDA